MDSNFAFDPFDPAQTHAIADVARRLAVEEPVLRLQSGFVMVSRYEDVRQVLLNSTVFANAGGFRPSGLHVPIEDRTLGELDPPEPVGFEGVHKMTAFVFGVSAFSSACGDILKPASSVVSTKTGVAPHSFTCSG